MAAEKRYYWLKLKEDFFDDKHIRYLRKMPDGDRLIIIYLRMQLFSLKNEGIIKYSQLMPTCAEELALSIDEDIEMVRFALTALQKIGLVEIWEDQTVYMAAMQDNIGSEGSSAERVRRHREKKALQCNNKSLPDVTHSLLGHGEIEKREKRKNPPTPQGCDERFDQFWAVYPKKIGKGAARKAFSRIKPDSSLLESMVDAVGRAKQSDQWKRDNGQYIPHASTWLNQRRWEDELTVDVQPDTERWNYL